MITGRTAVSITSIHPLHINTSLVQILINICVMFNQTKYYKTTPDIF